MELVMELVIDEGQGPRRPRAVAVVRDGALSSEKQWWDSLSRYDYDDGGAYIGGIYSMHKGRKW